MGDKDKMGCSKVVLFAGRWGIMVKIDVLAIGSLERDEEGNIVSAHSSSALIRSGERMIVVDTSTEYLRPAIKTSFKQIGVFPKDVDTVVLTHSHNDHIGNIDMFPNAKIMMHSAEENTIPNAETFDSNMQLTKEVRLVHTPGHTKGSVSVFVDAEMKYAITGDAIPLKSNYEKMLPPRINYDADIALESIKFISRYADLIVPGHDSPFATKR